MDLLSQINKQARGERKKTLKIRYVAVKNRDIVQNMSIDDLKAEVKSEQMTKYMDKISTGEIKTARSRNYKPQSTLVVIIDSGLSNFGG